MTANKSGTASGGSEAADTPILCETCLGPNPFISMQKQSYGKECKVSKKHGTDISWLVRSHQSFPIAPLRSAHGRLPSFAGNQVKA